MKEKIRFGSLSDGSFFEWGGKSFRKTSSRTAETMSGTKSSFVFETRDMVIVDKPDEIIDDWGDLVVPGIGYVGVGTSGGYLGSDPDDLMDSYIYTDKCN